VTKEVMPDYVRLLVRVGPSDAPAALAWAFEDRTAPLPRQEFSHLRNHATMLGLSSYVAALVGDVGQSSAGDDIEHRRDEMVVS
jgi:putative transposase